MTSPQKILLHFYKQFFAREGSCQEIISDNGPQFRSWKFSDYLKTENIKHLKSSLYHPQTNGEVERFNRTLKNAIQLAIIQSANIPQAITQFLHVYRSTPHAVTGVSPSELLHGRKMRTKLNIDAGQKEKPTPCVDVKIKQHQQKVKEIL